jgi:hypothetical protein
MIPRGRRRWRRSDGSCEPAKRSSRPFNTLRQSAHGGACPDLRQPEDAGDSAKVSLLRGGASLERFQIKCSRERQRVDEPSARWRSQLRSRSWPQFNLNRSRETSAASGAEQSTTATLRSGRVARR